MQPRIITIIPTITIIMPIIKTGYKLPSEIADQNLPLGVLQLVNTVVKLPPAIKIDKNIIAPINEIVAPVMTFFYLCHLR
jgi:hypothetical protein